MDMLIGVTAKKGHIVKSNEDAIMIPMFWQSVVESICHGTLVDAFAAQKSWAANVGSEQVCFADLEIGKHISGRRVVYDEFAYIAGKVTQIDLFWAKRGHNDNHLTLYANLSVLTLFDSEDWIGLDRETRLNREITD